MIHLYLRFYEELNDFLPLERRKKDFMHVINSKASIKDVIESLGVPHTEVELILVNHKSVDFNYHVQDGDRISIYPMFEAFDVTTLIRVRPEPLRKTRFILDVHLGKLAKYLRLLGFDTTYEKSIEDVEIAERSRFENRIVLTRDINLLKHKRITHGYWVRNDKPINQVQEILTRFDLYLQCKPLTRCMKCNGILIAAPKNEISKSLLPLTQQYYEKFMRCDSCQQIYWQGSHYEKLLQKISLIISKTS
ncbi:Mut7-C RNAse domain-containing protein [Legionella cardiaca]|uniref:Mut7-C RNAse domain-containing protein n=1 Tax=Legionella cardiaca TaxID=1071983 RepID=A0ABY8AV39_9GAMM|nr:Mut7-C RNAse domain-containing protein [Legionella cardiaca]WED44021.1 Mut7-C RNAse domain-containing protein [Legionella cardiaca]